MRTLTFTCASCDTTVVDSPVFHLGLAFCCAGCAADGPCMCSYDGPGAELAVADRAVVVAGDLQADPEITAAAIPQAIVEPPALAATTIAEPARPAATERPRPVVRPAAPADAGRLVGSRRS
ncbi:MAG: hypothetical protein MUE82_11400 [Chloroflexi bacterium]|jgi:hypothetical protein|nr:hypothetical protein [Chloroflexota bacterium]